MKITTREFVIRFSIFIITLGLIWTYAYISSQKDKKLVEERKLHRENLFENVKFQGDILHIEELGAGNRHRISVCVKLINIDIDTSKIIDGNYYFYFDEVITGLIFGGFDLFTYNKFLEMNEIKFNKNYNRKVMLYSANGDSLDVTERLYSIMDLVNCRDFIQ